MQIQVGKQSAQKKNQHVVLAEKKPAPHVVLAEIFESIQGEGCFTGTPALFIRTGMCNLACSWCDTPYTWKPGQTTYQKYEIKKILSQIAVSHLRHFVITGGEPMLQQSFIAEIRHSFPSAFIEVETNGTIPSILGVHTVDQFNISPKLSNSRNKWYRLNLHATNCIYKFVICDKSDVIEIEFFAEQNNIPREKIYLMPEGTTSEKILERAEWLIPVCQEKKFHYSTRLHILKNLQ